MSQPDFQASADAHTIASILRQAEVGDVISYESLSRAIGRDVRETSAIDTARKMVLRENRIVFDSVRGVGLKRLDDASIVDLSDKGRDTMRRHSRRVAAKLVCVDYDALPEDKKTKHNAALSLFGAIAELSGDKSQSRLQAAVSRTSASALPAAKAALAAFGIGGAAA